MGVNRVRSAKIDRNVRQFCAFYKRGASLLQVRRTYVFGRYTVNHVTLHNQTVTFLLIFREINGNNWTRFVLKCKEKYSFYFPFKTLFECFFLKFFEDLKVV